MHGPGPVIFLLDDFISTGSAPGLDSMTPLVLKNIAKYIVKHLTKIYNYSFTIGHHPYIWKNSQITPVFKNKGSTHAVKTFRPILFTSVVCKILEKEIV